MNRSSNVFIFALLGTVSCGKLDLLQKEKTQKASSEQKAADPVNSEVANNPADEKVTEARPAEVSPVKSDSDANEVKPPLPEEVEVVKPRLIATETVKPLLKTNSGVELVSLGLSFPSVSVRDVELGSGLLKIFYSVFVC
jgi:hypothetical protein